MKLERKPLAERIARAKQSTGPELAAASDILNTSIANVEQALVALGLGVETCCCIERTDDWSAYVGFRRYGRTWRLTYEWYSHDDPESTREEKALLEAAREERLEAAEHLDDLVDEVIQAAESLARRVRERAAKLDELAAELRVGK